MDTKDDKVLNFLKSYAQILKTDIDISGDIPLSISLSMPGGYIKINTVNGRTIAFVSVDEGLGPSMPVGPAAMTYAKLIVDLINGIYQIQGGSD